MYLVGAQVLLLAVGVAGVGVVTSGPGQSPLRLPGITEGSGPGDLQETDSGHTLSLPVGHLYTL